MRDIKFRAWDIQEKSMIDADSFYFSDEFEPFIDSSNRAQIGFEVMQYTGLKDNNGQEIYEGDIVLWEDKYIKVIYDYRLLANIRDYTLGVEVVGNIYENPELLKEKE